MKVRHYQELIVWQQAMDLVESVYKASKTFPREETYGLTSQVRRAGGLDPLQHSGRTRKNYNR